MHSSARRATHVLGRGVVLTTHQESGHLDLWHVILDALTQQRPRPAPATDLCQIGPAFLFFSNRFGCLGSLLLSLLVTGVLVAFFALR